ncbi:MAG: hypothetical protein CMJ94_01240 [Planctomycetes bacterium]|nr:hypothetical protein [Planctomycetota bacterium]
MARLVSRVRKRDGTEESFDGPRLADSLRAAVDDALPDDGWAEQLVETIRVALGPREQAVETAEIARVVVRTLRECGQVEAARAYRGFRRAVERAVAKLRVHTRQGRDSRTAPWDRARLAHSLLLARHLENSTARRVAALVERRLVMADLGHVTGRLVAAMADNECRSLGLRSDPLSSEAVGIDRSELRAWLGGDCLPSVLGSPRVGPEGQDPRPALGEELLARFALEEVLSGPQSEAMALGMFALPGLGDWLRPARVLLRRDPDEAEMEFWDRVRAEQNTARELQVFIPHSADWQDATVDAPRWLAAPNRRLRLATTHGELAAAWSRAGHWVQLPAASFAAASDELRQELADAGTVVLSWSPPRRLPPVAVRQREIVQGCAVVNLARAALEAGSADGPAFREELEEAIDLACRSLQSLARRAGAEEHARVVLLPGGLPTALRTLFPSEQLAGDQVRRTVLGIRTLFERRAHEVGLRLVHTAPPHPGPTGMRLAELDGLPPERAYASDWSQRSADGLPALSAFDTAPWLEFPAAAALQEPTWQRFVPNPSDLAGS